jgi:hypothetical protein
MSVQDLKPEGHPDLLMTYARMTLEPAINAQGGGRGKIMVWLAIGGLETLIGEGDPEAATVEAMRRLEQLADEVKPKVLALLKSQRLAAERNAP